MEEEMSVNTIAILKSSIYFQQKNTQNASIFNNAGEIGVSRTLGSGTGDLQVDKVFYETRTLSSGDTYTYDLTNLTQDLMGYSVPVSFSNIKGIVISNKGTNETDIISVSTSISNGLSSLLNGFTGEMPIYPQAALPFNKPIDGYIVDNTHKTLRINDYFGYGVQYEICIVGVE